MKQIKITCTGVGLAVILLGLTLSGGSGAQAFESRGLAAEMEKLIDITLQNGKIPSASVALVSGEGIIWSGAVGYSNLWAGTKAQTDTVYLIGSTFKTMSMYGLLRLMEQGRFQLDDPVQGNLPDIEIRENDPHMPVTFRHLLTHTSGLPADYGPHPVWGNTVPLPLEDYLKKSLRLTQPPLTKTVYSNTAYTLIAYLVEKISGIPYKRYIRQYIFEPMGMKDTAFEPRPDMEERLAIPYVVNAKTGSHVPTVRTKANVWPAGIVYGTVLDQAKWLIANLNHGVYQGYRFIQEETFQEVMTRQFDQFTGPISAGWLNDTTGYGLTWWISQRNGDKLFAHSGSVTGYTAFLVGNLNKKTGFAILTNGNQAHEHLFELAVKALDLLEEFRN
jgi:CubicO group peptidase (beta-lactamase class C family)